VRTRVRRERGDQVEAEGVGTGAIDDKHRVWIVAQTFAHLHTHTPIHTLSHVQQHVQTFAHLHTHTSHTHTSHTHTHTFAHQHQYHHPQPMNRNELLRASFSVRGGTPLVAGWHTSCGTPLDCAVCLHDDEWQGGQT